MLCSDKCPRGLEGCDPLANIVADDPRVDDFVCIGLNSTRRVAQDRFTHCFKNSMTDTQLDHDEYDIMSIISVLSEGLLVDQFLLVDDGQGQPTLGSTNGKRT